MAREGYGGDDMTHTRQYSPGVSVRRRLLQLVPSIQSEPGRAKTSSVSEQIRRATVPDTKDCREVRRRRAFQV